MREILFRGQTRRKGQKVWMDGSPVDSNWVEGYGVCMGKGDFSLIYAGSPVEKFTVYTDTVGQFTGLTDKNGKKIFEGDIVKTHYANAKKCDFVEVIVFRNGRFCAEGNIGKTGKSWANLWDCVHHLPQDKTVYMDGIEVIGNIHDNPEILEVTE